MCSSSTSKGVPPPEQHDHQVAQEIDWEDFRDHLATADQEGNRRWIYPKRVSGRFYRWRTYLSWLLLAILFTGPFIRIQGNPLLLFTLLFYAIFARFREQACTFICPYGRFQSAVLDENTMVVAYDHKRGEKRAPLHRDQTNEQRQADGLGDCVSCRQCVAVCPTGIDIRNGTQMECVNCTACIDACDAIMDKVRRPRGLIRYASLNSIERGEKFQITPRMIGYTVVLGLLVAVLGFLVFTRSSVETMLLRAPGALFQTTADGDIENIYTLKLINKTSRDIPVQLKIENIAGKLTVMGGGSLVVPREQLVQTSVLIVIDPRALKTPNTKLKIGLYSDGKRLETAQTVFVGPRESSPAK